MRPLPPSLLVTGAAGFVGHTLGGVLHIRTLGITDEGEGESSCFGEVVGVVRPGGRKAGPGYDRLIAADWSEPGVAAALVGAVRPDVVLHLGGVTGTAQEGVADDLWRVNVAGSLALAQASWSVGARFVAVSTGYVLGECEAGREEDPLNPIGPYAASKAAMELQLRHEADQLGVRIGSGPGAALHIVRPFNHAGPGQPAGLAVADWIHQLRAGRRPGVDFRAGWLGARRDLGDVRDLVRGLMWVAQGNGPGLVHLCSGKTRTMADILAALFSLVQQLAGEAPRTAGSVDGLSEPVRSFLAERAAAPPPPGALRNNGGDAGRARAAGFGYRLPLMRTLGDQWNYSAPSSREGCR